MSARAIWVSPCSGGQRDQDRQLRGSGWRQQSRMCVPLPPRHEADSQEPSVPPSPEYPQHSATSILPLSYPYSNSCSSVCLSHFRCRLGFTQTFLAGTDLPCLETTHLLDSKRRTGFETPGALCIQGQTPLQEAVKQETHCWQEVRAGPAAQLTR